MFLCLEFDGDFESFDNGLNAKTEGPGQSGTLYVLILSSADSISKKV